MKIAISGTPGTGKTSIAKILAKEIGYPLLDLNEFAKARKLTLGTDSARNCIIIDISALKKEVVQMEGDSIIEGHLAHLCDADIFIILRTNPKELSRRLRKRDWREEKIRENVEAEIMNICLDEAVALHDKKVFEIDTARKTAEEIAEIIKKIANGGKKELKRYAPGIINWMDYIR